MLETMNFEKAVLDNLRILPNDKQQEVLDFVKFLVQKAGQIKQVSELSDSSVSSTTQDKKQLSLQEIARLTVEERHKLLAPYIAATAEDFLNDPEVREFSVNDSEFLDGYDFSKAVRGKYHEKYRSYQGKIPVNITSNDGDRYVTLRTVKVEAIVTPDGKLTVQLDGDIMPGEYRVTLIIEEPATPNTEQTSLENERSHLE
ncbi:DUF2281 domain-containing protein [Tolypothrix sp. VBCCA 56010]|uniref:DUF2281 domain-containing protein n=1 Tax=Tolypothrix sp. VBCCA 56010 TaxID=3137731 RepID=UPI003D7F18C1